MNGNHNQEIASEQEKMSVKQVQLNKKLSETISGQTEMNMLDLGKI